MTDTDINDTPLNKPVIKRDYANYGINWLDIEEIPEPIIITSEDIEKLKLKTKNIMGELIDEIRVCKHHQKEEQVPLIWTYFFTGSEYWCPACGDHHGMLAGDIVKITPEIEANQEAWNEKGKTYLRALSAIHNDNVDNLPKKEQKNAHELVKNWKYKFKL